MNLKNLNFGIIKIQYVCVFTLSPITNYKILNIINLNIKKKYTILKLCVGNSSSGTGKTSLFKLKKF